MRRILINIQLKEKKKINNLDGHVNVLILASLFFSCLFLSVTAVSVCLHAVGHLDWKKKIYTNKKKKIQQNHPAPR